MTECKYPATAEYYGIPEATVVEMFKDQDEAIKDFNFYPDYKWQLDFQKNWLQRHGYTEAADKAEEHLVWLQNQG